jgi:hypothetical protein
MISEPRSGIQGVPAREQDPRGTGKALGSREAGNTINAPSRTTSSAAQPSWRSDPHGLSFTNIYEGAINTW